jgi:excisionase family DNA binding protein
MWGCRMATEKNTALSLPKTFLLTREELAELLRVSQRTADNLIRSGEIRSVRIGGRIRGRVLVPRGEVLKFVGIEEPTTSR